MFDNTLNKSKENIDNNENNLYSNNNNNINYNQSSNNNRFIGSINNQSNLPINSGNVVSDVNRFGNNTTTDPNQYSRNSYTPFVSNRFQDNGINKSLFFQNGKAIPVNFNRNNFIPNNFNNFQSNINQHYLNQNPNNFNGYSNFNRNNQNPNNFNGQPNFNLNQNPNNFNGQPNFNQNPNNFNGQPNFNQNNFNQIPNNFNGQQNFNPNNFNGQPNFNQNPNNFNGQPNFNQNNFNQNPNNFNDQPNFNQIPNNFNGQPNFNQNPNHFNGQSNFFPNNFNQNPNNFNGQQNLNSQQNINPNNLNQNQSNVNSQQNVNQINPNNLDQNINNINEQPKIDTSNLNDTPIVENDTTPITDVTSKKDTNLNDAPITNSDVSLNKEPLETDKVKSTYNPRSKKRITFIALSSMFGTGAVVAAIAVPIALIAPNVQNTIQPITTRIAYDLETKNVKVVVESNKLPHNISSYSVFREMPDKIFEPIPENDITLVPIGNSEVNLDFTDTNLTANSIYKVKINDGLANGIEVISTPDENIKIPKISITSQPQNQILLASTTSTTTTLSVSANIAVNPIANQEISYQWKSSDTNSANEADWTPIVNETKPTYTYDTTNILVGVKKYFKCILSYKYANPVISTIVYIEKVDNQPVITITTHPEITTSLTSASTNFSLVANASITNEISGQQASYQWQSSSSENGTYTNIDGATSATYRHVLVANTKNSWRDTWYKCNVTYPGATLVETSRSLVKMTLTEAEAKAELLKWLAVEKNTISVLTRYFNEPIETSVKNTFYKSLHEHHLPEGNPTLVVHSIEPMQIIANNNYPTGYKSYKIKLKTTSPANIAPKATGASTRTVYQAGMIIEFNTLFSFGSEKAEFVNTNSNSKYNMIFEPSFTTYQSKPTTTLLWTSDTTNGEVAPSADNPYKKGAYPVRFYTNATSTSPIIEDSVFLPSRLQNVYTSGTKSYLYSMIPTYNIKTTN